MNINEAINAIHAPKPMTGVINAALTGDFSSISHQSAINTSLETAQAKLQSARTAQSNCKSDWAWWGFMGDISYWSAIVNILEAAKITGSNKLPDIEKPNLEGCVTMDACSKVEDFGKKVLDAARLSKAV